MVYQGRGGNDNQFSSQKDCESSCIEQPSFIKPLNVVSPPKFTTQGIRSPSTTSFTKEPQSSFANFNKPIKIEKPKQAGGTRIADTRNDIGEIGAPAPVQPMYLFKKKFYVFLVKKHLRQ